jgi:hypothetical protein
VTVLAGRVSVAAGNVSVTVAAGIPGASVVVWIDVVVCAPAPGEVVVAGRVRPGSDDVIAVESAPLPPLPHPAVATATVTPKTPAVA